MRNPCYDPIEKIDCPDRRPGCAANCKRWKQYTEKREEMYRQRKTDYDLGIYISDQLVKRKLKRLKRRQENLRRKG